MQTWDPQLIGLGLYAGHLVQTVAHPQMDDLNREEKEANTIFAVMLLVHLPIPPSSVAEGRFFTFNHVTEYCTRSGTC
jgi:hypothetical protein